ncbi:MAG TPA: hypothetical protein VJP40_03580, partial [bacterium]|nr:hypothetical protein [bacterium]
ILVGSWGASKFHALRYPEEVDLLRTLSPDEWGQSGNGLLSYLACADRQGPEKCRSIVEENSTRREAWATREVVGHLRLHPGASVVFVFGAGHRFCDDFERENFRPSISTLEVKLGAFGIRKSLPTVEHCP